MRQFLKDEFIQFATQFTVHQCDPNTSISFTAIYFSLLALYGQTHSRIHTFFIPPFLLLCLLYLHFSKVLPLLSQNCFFSIVFVGYVHLRSTAARFKNAASLAVGVM